MSGNRQQYWKKIHGPKDFFENFPETIEQLKDGDLKSAGFHQIGRRGELSICAVKTGGKGRLLCFTTDTEGEPSLVLAEDLPNHEYDDSWLLNMKNPREASVFAKIRKKSKNTVEELSIDQPDKPRQAVHEMRGKFIPALYHNDDWIIISDHQNKVIMEMQLPCLIEGPGGSGKTLLAYMKMVEAALKKDPAEKTKSILFVTKSKMLADKIDKLWKAHCALDTRSMHDVVILSSDEVCLQYGDLNHDPKMEVEFVGKEFFLSWLRENKTVLCKQWIAHLVRKEEEKQEKKKNRQQVNNTDMELAFNACTAKPDHVYQEMRIISVYLAVGNEDAYKKLGHDQCLFANEDKDLVLFLYGKYLKYLDTTEIIQEKKSKTKEKRKKKKMDASFVVITKKNVFDLGFVDEFQDNSCLQLAQYFWLANEKVCFCGDPAQAISDFIYQSHFVLHDLIKDPSRCYRLYETYRSLPAINEGANAWCTARDIAIGLRPEKMKLTHKEGERGEAVWMDLSDEKISELSLPEELTVIIFNEKNRENVKLFFKTTQVFSIEEYKGLEDDVVILYHPLEQPGIRKTNHLFQRWVEDPDAEQTGKKSKNPSIEYSIDYHRGNAALRRARKVALVIDNNKSDTRFVSKFMQTSGNYSHKLSGTLMASVNEKNWEERFDALLDAGNTIQAFDLANKWLKDDKTVIAEWMRAKIIRILQNKDKTISDRRKQAEVVFENGLGKNLKQHEAEFNDLARRYLQDNPASTMTQASMIVHYSPIYKRKTPAKQPIRANPSSSKEEPSRKQNLLKVSSMQKTATATQIPSLVTSASAKTLAQHNHNSKPLAGGKDKEKAKKCMKSKADIIQNFSNQLKEFYHQYWPYESFHERFCQNYHDENFLAALSSFYDYINLSTTRHDKRSRKLKGMGIEFTVRSKEFSELNQKLLQLLPNKNISFFVKLINFIQNNPEWCLYAFIILAIGILLGVLSAPVIASRRLGNYVKEFASDESIPIEDITDKTMVCHGNWCNENDHDIFIASIDLNEFEDFADTVNPLNSISNNQLAKEIDIDTCEHSIYQQRGWYSHDFYVAVKLPDARTAILDSTSLQERNRLFQPNNNKAKFAVAATFMCDLDRGFYGFLNGRLYLNHPSCRPLQEDSFKKTMQNFWNNAADALYGGQFIVPPLSLEDVKTMLAIYQSLAGKKTPGSYPQFAMQDSVYQALVEGYIMCCQEVLGSYRAVGEKMTVQYKDGYFFNLLLATCIKESEQDLKKYESDYMPPGKLTLAKR